MDNQDEISKITINGVDYDLDEAQNLIDYGKRTREAEQKYNTKFDNVWPEYNRSQNRIKELEAEVQEARALKEKTEIKSDGNPQSLPTNSELSPSQKEAARRLGVLFQEDLKNSGYLTKEETLELLQQKEAEKESIAQVMSQAKALASEINGSDGRPRFRQDHVMAYAAQFKIGNLQEAYEKMYSEELDEWKAQQIEASKKPSLRTLKTGGVKNPPQIKVTRENARDLMHEAIYGGNDE